MQNRSIGIDRYCLLLPSYWHPAFLLASCPPTGLLPSYWPPALLEGTISRRKPTDLDDLAETAQKLFQNAFSRIDRDILQSCKLWGATDGATALTALHTGQFLFVANAGDSRAVLSRGGKAVRLTRDHKPHVEAERRRIVGSGGMMIQVRAQH